MNLNLVSVKVKKSPKYHHARFSFRCRCRAIVDLMTEELSALRFCRKEDCPASIYAAEVYAEHLSVERRKQSLAAFEIAEGPSKLFIPGEGNNAISAVQTLAALSALMRKP